MQWWDGRAGNGINRSNSSNRPKIQHIQGLMAAPVVHTPSSRPSSVAGGVVAIQICYLLQSRGPKVQMQGGAIAHGGRPQTLVGAGEAHWCSVRHIAFWDWGTVLGWMDLGAEAQLHGEGRVGCEEVGVRVDGL